MKTTKTQAQNSPDQHHAGEKTAANMLIGSHILQLQHKIGNPAVRRMMSLKSGRQVQRTVDGDPDNAPYMTDKLVTRWAQSSKRTETTAVKESKAANEVLGEYVSTALEPGSAKLASHIVGKKWWQSQQRMEAQVDAEAEHTNNWLDVLQHERTTSKEK